MTRRVRDEGGFALLAVLWVMVGVASLALLYRLAAREAVAAARNRADLTVAAWRAEGCAEAARAAISQALRAGRDEGPDSPTWAVLDRVVAADALAAGCEVRLLSAGRGLDPNTADREMLLRLLTAADVPVGAADSMADALIDWRDPDSEPRPRGAEAGWYIAAGRLPPRNGPLADVRELARVRGWDRAGLDTLFSLEPGRIDLNRAPPAVLAALPGFTPEALSRVTEMRWRGARLGGLIELEGALSRGARESLLRHFPEASVLTTTAPDAWVLEARAREGAPPVTAVVELRLVRGGERAAVVRRRRWFE